MRLISAIYFYEVRIPNWAVFCGAQQRTTLRFPNDRKPVIMKRHKWKMARERLIGVKCRCWKKGRAGGTEALNREWGEGA